MITYCRNGSIFYDNHYKRTDLLLGWLIIFQYKNISCMIKWLDFKKDSLSSQCRVCIKIGISGLIGQGLRTRTLILF